MNRIHGRSEGGCGDPATTIPWSMQGKRVYWIYRIHGCVREREREPTTMGVMVKGWLSSAIGAVAREV